MVQSTQSYVWTDFIIDTYVNISYLCEREAMMILSRVITIAEILIVYFTLGHVAVDDVIMIQSFERKEIVFMNHDLDVQLTDFGYYCTRDYDE